MKIIEVNECSRCPLRKTTGNMYTLEIYVHCQNTKTRGKSLTGFTGTFPEWCQLKTATETKNELPCEVVGE